MRTERSLILAVRDAIPKRPPDIVEWAERYVKFPSSARSKNFKVEITPWIKEPLYRAVDNATRSIDFRKPVQSGGSALGEVLMLYWIMFWNGFFQYNWSNDKRARDRWASRVEGILQECAPVNERLEQLDYSDGEVNFGNVFFRMQGSFVESNLDSDSVRLQINEELHAWEPGHLKKAEGRSTAVWDYKRVNISNAGVKKDQFDQSHKKGTDQKWMVKCPGCSSPHHQANSVYHYMRTRWEEKKAHLGGLRYDADGARVGPHLYNYNKIRPTIRFQMPCGFTIHNEDLIARRALSLSGLYSAPSNPNAELKHRSYTYEAASVDFIDWMQLIQDKHEALRARALGDPQPWITYCQERECIPYDPDEVPITNVVEVRAGLRKSRTGLFGKKVRLFTLDYQGGEKEKQELPHWWLVIRDAQVVQGRLKTLLVFEGKVESDDQVVGILKEHKCNMWQGIADTGHDAFHVYAFCMVHGINCVKGGKEDWYIHKNGARRIFSPERPLHAMINRPPKFPYVEVNDGRDVKVVPNPMEPMFFLYSKAGIRERLHFLRNNTDWMTPEDVSEDYKAHMDSEEREKYISPSDGSESYRWVQKKSRNDLFVCECYIALLLEQAGMIWAKDETNATKDAK